MEIVTPMTDQEEESLYYTFRPGNAEELTRLVREAFAEVVYPGKCDGDLIVSGCPSCCAECGETHALFQGKSWRELAESAESLQNFEWSGLALLTPSAWRYYLPAYLSVSLSGGAGAENVLESALRALTPWPPAELPESYGKSSAEWFAARAFDFTAPQLECLAAYTSAASVSAPEDEDWDALATYWQDRAVAGTGVRI